MRIYKKVITYIVLVCTLLTVCPLGMPYYAQAEGGREQSEFEYMYNRYKDIAAYSKAVYTGGYDAGDFGDEMSDLYAFGHLYTKLSNPKRGDFDGYLHTLDEAKTLFGEDDEGVLAAIENEAEYVSLKYDNSFRHEKDVADVDGVKRDAWFSDKYIRKDKNSVAVGGMAFGIKDGSRIGDSDSGLTFVFEYLDNIEDNITLTNSLFTRSSHLS